MHNYKYMALNVIIIKIWFADIIISLNFSAHSITLHFKPNNMPYLKPQH